MKRPNQFNPIDLLRSTILKVAFGDRPNSNFTKQTSTNPPAEVLMEIREQLSQQRVKYIVSSYQLSDNEVDKFNTYLDELLQIYPPPLIELALVETLVDQWSRVPMLRGVEFLTQSHNKLKAWESQPIVSTITPAQFQQIAGLDPTPVFGSTELPPTRPIMRPS